MEITKCKNCGYELYPLDTVCDKCGTKVTTAAPDAAYEPVSPVSVSEDATDYSDFSGSAEFAGSPDYPGSADYMYSQKLKAAEYTSSEPESPDYNAPESGVPQKRVNKLKPVKTTDMVVQPVETAPKSGIGVARILILIGCTLCGVALVAGCVFALLKFVIFSDNDREVVYEADYSGYYDDEEEEDYDDDVDEEYADEEDISDEAFDENENMDESEGETDGNWQEVTDFENSDEESSTDDGPFVWDVADGEYDRDGILFRESDREWINDLYNSLVADDYLGVKDMISDPNAFNDKAMDYAYTDFEEWEDPNFSMAHAFKFRADDGKIFGVVVHKDYEAQSESDPYTDICAFVGTEFGGFGDIYGRDHCMMLFTKPMKFYASYDPETAYPDYTSWYLRDCVIYYDNGETQEVTEDENVIHWGGG